MSGRGIRWRAAGRRRIAALLVTIALAIPSSIALADAAAAGVKLEWMDCPYPPDLARTVRCAHLFLPGAETTWLPVAVVQHDPSGPSESAMLFLQGGPGFATLEEAPFFGWPDWAEAAGMTRDLVLFDYRGTGLAFPRDFCFEIRETVRESLAIGWFSTESLNLFAEAKAACHRRMVAQGLDLTQFSTQQFVADVLALMDVLPYSEWTLFGASHGSLIAQELMRLEPAGLSSVILDGVVPPGVDLSLEDPALLDEAMATIDRVCPSWRMDRPDCHRYAGDFLASLQTILDDLSEAPRWVTIEDWSSPAPYKVRLEPAIVLYALQSALTYPDGANFARDAVVEAALGDHALLNEMIDFWLIGLTLPGVHEQVFFSVLCGDERAWTQEDFARRSSATRFYGEYLDHPSAIHPCEHWTPVPAASGDPVSSTIPTLIFSGEYDPLTPVAWGERVAAGLENSFHFVIPRGGHGALMENGCAMQIMRDFLTDSGSEPVSRCLEKTVPGIRDPG